MKELIKELNNVSDLIFHTLILDQFSIDASTQIIKLKTVIKELIFSHKAQSCFNTIQYLIFHKSPTFTTASINSSFSSLNFVLLFLLSYLPTFFSIRFIVNDQTDLLKYLSQFRKRIIFLYDFGTRVTTAQLKELD